MGSDEGDPSSGGSPSTRPCSKCGQRERRPNSSWCSACLNEQAAVYRARTRPRPVTEERVCALEGCDVVFTWSSMHPKQECCSKSHSGTLRWQRGHPRTEDEILPEGQKRCSKCKETGGVDDFTPSQWARRSGQCRRCRSEYRSGRTHLDRATNSSAQRRWRLRKYHAPFDDVEAALAAQGNLCACCGDPYTGERSFHIDHDHATGLYRGMLCGNCNTGLGYFADSEERLRLAIAYLSRHAATG